MFYYFLNYDDIAFTYRLHGDQGSETVDIHDGTETTRNVELKQWDVEYVAFNDEIRIEFTNDGGSGDTDKNVYFESDQYTSVEGPTGNSWNCGSEEEN